MSKNNTKADSTLRGWLLDCFGLCIAVLGPVGTGLLVVMLIATVFYQEENWRGRRAWARAQAELVAGGKVVDWDKFIPPPVADEENFFAAPHMQEWFVGRGARDLSRRMDFANFATLKSKPETLLAEVKIVPPDAVIAPADADLVLSLHEQSLSLSPAPEAASTNAALPILPLLELDKAPWPDAISRSGQI